MELLTFEIRGKMAHFRKYYANNTAFSFSIPPRTTLMGIVAAAMGWPKDTYYEKLSSQYLHFGIRVLQPLKKSFHRVNFLSIKSTGNLAKGMSSDFRGHGGRIQTPFEVVTPFDLTKGELAYQVFISPTQEGNAIFQAIAEHFCQKPPVYTISLGTANFQGSINKATHWPKSQIEKKFSDKFVLLHSAIPTRLVSKLLYEEDQVEHYNTIEEELMPGDFISDHSRELNKMNHLLFSVSNVPLRVQIKDSFWSMELDGERINFQFMDI